MAVAASQVSSLLTILEQAYRKTSWHGPNLRASFRGVSPAQAVWRPHPARHSIAEQVLHAAYWKYVVRRRLTGAKRGSFPLKGSNWFPVQSLHASEWLRFGTMLEAEHEQLCDAVTSIVGRNRAALEPLHWKLITGLAAHDVYHAGQIRLLRALQDA